MQSNANRKLNMQKLLAPAALVILYVFFSIFGKNFFGYEGFKQILQSSYYIGFMAFGVTFVIITGGIDLSIGTVMMCSAIIGGTAFTNWGWPVPLALVLVLISGLFFGLCNGLMIAKAKLPPFIATLGTMMVSQGFGSIISNVRTMHYSPTYVGDWFRPVFYISGNFPVGAIWLLGAFVIAAFVLNKTRLGRYNFAIGSNERTTRLSGVNVRKVKRRVYALTGLLVAGAAIIQTSRIGSMDYASAGSGFEMDAIAAVIVGGTSMSGGRGSVVGTVFGTLIVAVMNNLLNLIGVDPYLSTAFKGAIIIAAVLLQRKEKN